ncbi:MAG: hypothetical protein ACRCZI_04985, partial [Cetobacterium sp.]
MDIEITKVKSTNYIDLYIDRSQKRIYRDMTESTKEIKDLDKQLYVTTYLKPNTKTNTIHDELEHKVINSDGKRYLEISYSKEPENIYLWVVKNNKVEKLYTGVFKEVLNSKGLIGEKGDLQLIFNYDLNKKYTFKTGANGEIVSVDGLIWHQGSITHGWNDDSMKFVNYTVTVDNNNPETTKSNGGNKTFTILNNTFEMIHTNFPGGI